LAQALGSAFSGGIMCDGDQAYRPLLWRLHCWAHLVHKAQAFGTQVLETFEVLMDAVYAAQLQALFEQCRAHTEASHPKTRALARELLLDWNTFWGVLDDPTRPLTNNEAERALRHWVIAQRISLGTRTEQGSRAFTLLASVIETCRKRAVSPWSYLVEVIRQRRCRLPAPPLPQPAS
jgi:transposase